MRIVNEIELAAPPAQVFEALLDLERIAVALPGADLDRVDDDRYTGTVRLGVGPVRVQYEGQVRLTTVDRDARRIAFAARGDDVRGRGGAEVVVTAAVHADGARSKVALTTDLDVRGRLAQVGQAALSSVSERLLREFARNLERELNGVSDAGGRVDSQVVAAPWQPLAAGVSACALVVGVLWWRSRRSLAV